MRPDRFATITRAYPRLRLAVIGDFCLDRYLEIDPARQEVSLETGLPVHNVVNIRSQPGGAGTILNNLCALGIGTLHPVGFSGNDGEGSELRDALRSRPGVDLSRFLVTPERRTFTYGKPLIVEPGRAPVELNRLDMKNWTPTPAAVEKRIIDAMNDLVPRVDAMILLDQVDVPDTGVITTGVREAIRDLSSRRPDLFIIADSRRGLRDFPSVCFKMNRSELASLTGHSGEFTLADVKASASTLAARNHRPVFVSLSENGIVGATASGEVEHVLSMPVRGEIDIVGAGDAVTANLATALAAGATLREAMEIAMAAASIVVHQLGTTGTASVDQVAGVLAD